MTNRIPVGTPVTVSASRGTYLNNYDMTHDDLVVLSHANGIGYGIGPSTNDPAKAHSRHGWIYFSAYEVTPKPFTFKDIQVGDTIRRTQKFKGGATEVREGVVTKKASSGRYASTADDSYILAYDTDDYQTGAALELLNRPEPEPVKEAWEDATVLTRQYDDFPKDTFVREDDGSWTIHYGKGTGTFKVTASENLADYLEDAKVKVLATA